MGKKLAQLSSRLNTLTVFRPILEDPAIKKLKDLLWLCGYGEDVNEIISLYSDFVAHLYQKNPDLSEYLWEILTETDNLYVENYNKKGQVPPPIQEALQEELTLLNKVAQLTPEEIKSAIGYHEYLPTWQTRTKDIVEEYRRYLAQLPQKDCGIFEKAVFFTYNGKEPLPVNQPEIPKLSHFFGYQEQRQLIGKTLESFLKGNKPMDLLLYGDAGTGKSSTVKALVKHHSQQGLRLVEIKKDHLESLPALLEFLAPIPLNFILFIDDLSFASADDRFASLKATLEGSVVTQRKNALICATSNRRHLVQESLKDRQDESVHLNDMLQETTGLSGRFALRIAFRQPSKEEFLGIVDHLAQVWGITLDREALHQQAEAYALERNGRSPRVAQQFIAQRLHLSS